MFTKKELEDVESKWIFDDTLLKLCEHYGIICVYQEYVSGVRNVCSSVEDLNSSLSFIKIDTGAEFFVPMLVNAVKKDFTQNNHYVGLFIKKNNDHYEITYIDPMGHMINSEIRNRLYTAFGQISRLELYKGNLQFAELVDNDCREPYYDGNTDDCAPMLLYLAALVSNKKQLPILINLSKSKQIGQKLRNTILKDLKDGSQFLTIEELSYVTSMTDLASDTLVTDPIKFPRCEYYTRFQDTTVYNMQDIGHWGTYFRSVYSRHDKPTKFKEKELTLNLEGIPFSKAGSYQSVFFSSKYKKITHSPIATLSNIPSSIIYDAVLQYKQSICAAVYEEVSHLGLLQIKAVYANTYPCLMVEVLPTPHQFGRKTDITHWAEVTMACYVAATNNAAHTLNIPIEMVIRSSFGHNAPSVSGTGQCFRINIGIVPNAYVNVLVEGIKKLAEMVTDLKNTKVTYNTKQINILQLFNEIATLRKDAKKTTTILTELTRQPSYLDFIADKMARVISGYSTMQNVWQEIINRITKKPDHSITFNLESTEFKLLSTNKAIFKPSEADLSKDKEFWNLLILINSALQNRELAKLIEIKKALGLYKILEKANLEIIRKAPPYNIEDEYPGSDSGVEGEIDDRKLYARKVVVTTGMKAINLAAFLVRAYCRVQGVACNFDTKYMYYETGEALKFCNDFLTKAFGESKTKVTISCIDLNYCSAVGHTSLSSDLFQKLPKGYPVILDYTSSITQLIAFSTRELLKRAPIVILLNSGLKNEQLGADINTYGTVRIVTSHKYNLDILYNLAVESLHRTPESMLPKIAHQIRKTYKDLGCVVTHQAVFKQELKVLGAPKDIILDGCGYWDALAHMNNLCDRGMKPVEIISRLSNLQKLPAHSLSQNIFWEIFNEIDLFTNNFIENGTDEDIDSFVTFLQYSSWRILRELEGILNIEDLWNSWTDYSSDSPDIDDILDEYSKLDDEDRKVRVRQLLTDERGLKRIGTDGLRDVLNRIDNLNMNSDDDPLDALSDESALEGCPDELLYQDSDYDDQDSYGGRLYHDASYYGETDNNSDLSSDGSYYGDTEDNSYDSEDSWCLVYSEKRKYVLNFLPFVSLMGFYPSLQNEAFIATEQLKRFYSDSELQASADFEHISSAYSRTSARIEERKIVIVPEYSHLENHGFNIHALTAQITHDNIDPSTTICLERKQLGNNLGMRDVIFLASILQHNNHYATANMIAIPETVMAMPIYHDALLYNKAVAHGIQVIGVEGKGLVSSKSDPAHNLRREEAMVKNIEAILSTGRSVIFLVGSSHVENLRKTLPNSQVMSLKHLVGYSDDSTTDYADLESLVIKHLPNQGYNPSGNNIVAASGGSVMKIIEVKESIFYLFTEMIPLFSKSEKQEPESFLSKEGFWIAAHFTAGVAFAWSIPGGENIAAVSKLLAPVSATSSYALRHYYHEEFKQQYPGYTIIMDGGFAALTTLSVAYLTGNYGLLAKSAGQGLALGVLSSYGKEETSSPGWFAGNLASIAVACKKASTIMPENNFNGMMVTIHNVASLLTMITLTHKVVSNLADQIIDNLGMLNLFGQEE